MNKEKIKKVLFEAIFLLLVCFTGVLYFHIPQQDIRYHHGLDFIRETEKVFKS